MLQGPPLYEDELLSSAIVRLCRRYLLNTRHLASAVLGLSHWRPRFLGATPLQALAEVFRIPAAEALWRHTAFPYAVAFLGDAGLDSALNYAAGENSKLGSVLQNATAGGGYRRFCSRCTDVELRVHGESYWHRQHNLPGVLACAQHGEYLKESEMPIAMASRFPLELPHEVKGKALGRGQLRPSHLAVAQLSFKALQSTAADRPGLLTASFYRQLAVAHGWLSSAAPVSATLVTSRVAEEFGNHYLARWSLGTGKPNVAWPALMLRDGTPTPFIPLKHILLQVALSAERQPGQRSLAYRPSGPSGSEDSLVDRHYSAAARGELARCLASGEMKLTTEAFLRRVGAWQAYRHRLHALPRLRKVVLQFRASPVSVKRLKPGSTLFRKRPDERTS
jgi:hypothetical protein